MTSYFHFDIFVLNIYSSGASTAVLKYSNVTIVEILEEVLPSFATPRERKIVRGQSE